MWKEKLQFIALGMSSFGTSFSDLLQISSGWGGCLIRAGSELVKEQELEPGSLENHSGLASTAPSQHLEPDVIQL